MGASLKTGLTSLESVSSGWSAVVVMVCDQSLVTPALLAELIITACSSGQPIVATQYDDIRGVPVLFETGSIALLREVTDAAGAAQLLRQAVAGQGAVRGREGTFEAGGLAGQLAQVPAAGGGIYRAEGGQ